MADCPLYKSKECINYIIENLVKYNLDIYLINNTTIFITWINLEYNINVSNKKKK